MVYKEIKFGTHTSIVISGNNEKITVELRRGSSEMFDSNTNVMFNNNINLHPGFWESIFPTYCEHPIIFMSEEEKKKAFQCRIKKCLQIYSEFAREYVKKEEEEERQTSLKQKTDAQNQMDINQFIESVVKEASK